MISVLKKIVGLFSVILMIETCFGQVKTTLNPIVNPYYIDSMDLQLIDKKYYIFGEIHPYMDETHCHQLKLINNLINSNIKKIYLYIELPPSLVHLIYKFYKTGDSTWLNYGSIFTESDKEYFLILRNIEDIEFIFIPIEVEHKVNTGIISLFMQNIAIGDYKTEDYYENYKIIDPIVNYYSPSKARKAVLRLIESKIISNIDDKNIDSVEKKYLLQEIDVIKRYKYMKNFSATRGKGYPIREKYMAEIIDQNYDANDSVAHIITVGRDHIIPTPGNILPELMKYSAKLDTTNTIRMAVLYSKGILFLKNDEILYDKKLYPSQKPLQSLIDRRIFDMILLPPGETVGEKK